MKIEIPELKTQHMTVAEKRACVEGMGHVIFHFQREAAYLFLNGGRDSEVMAERLRDMSTELLMTAGTLAEDASKMEADKARLDEFREEMEKSLKPKRGNGRRRREGSDCVEVDGRCDCNYGDIEYSHELALREDNIRTLNDKAGWKPKHRDGYRNP
jgi:hypothetical protein